MTDDAILCPGCGYDLRAMASGRCPECGLAVDADELHESGVPWAHRRKLGPVRAFLRTVMWFTFGSRRLALESAKPQQWEDARLFGRLTAAAMALLFLAVLTAVLAAGDGYAVFAVDDGGDLFFLNRRNVWWKASPVLDAILPWCAGATLWWALPACAIALAASLPAVYRSVVSGRRISDAQRERAVSLLTYTMSPLLWLWPAAVVMFLGISASWWSIGTFLEPWGESIEQVLGLLTLLLLLIVLGTAPWQPERWYGRVTHAGTIRSLLAAIGWLTRLALAVLFWIGLVPWCIGFGWLVIDSFRR